MRDCSLGGISPFSTVFSKDLVLETRKTEGLFGKGCEKARKHMCVTDRHDMILAIKMALNPNTTNQPIRPEKGIYYRQ